MWKSSWINAALSEEWPWASAESACQLSCPCALKPATYRSCLVLSLHESLSIAIMPGHMITRSVSAHCNYDMLLKVRCEKSHHRGEDACELLAKRPDSERLRKISAADYSVDAVICRFPTFRATNEYKREKASKVLRMFAVVPGAQQCP